MNEAHKTDRFAPASGCWCGWREGDDSPFSPEYRVCERCGAHYAKRWIRDEAVSSFYSYENYWQRQQRSKGHPVLEERYAALAADGRFRDWLEVIHRHTSPDRGMAVEVGSAEGGFQMALREAGWRAAGLEPDPETVRRVRERTGTDVRAGTFPQTPLPRAALFIASDVLEHAPDQQAFLRAAHDTLLPGGILFLQLPVLEEKGFGPSTACVFDPGEHAFIHTRQSLQWLLETCGFEVLENDAYWRPAHELAVARKLPPRRPGLAPLANLPEMFSPRFTSFMEEINAFAREHGLRTFLDWSKIWEYPRLWYGGLDGVNWGDARVLDLGSEASPFPWYLAVRGAKVMLVESDPQWQDTWSRLRERLGVEVDWRLVAGDLIPAPSRSFDVVTSFSVLEHQADKRTAVDEVLRVLKPGGYLAMSFDICEPNLGMTYPEWGGTALTMREFESLVWRRREFALPGRCRWNTRDIPAFLRWHRTSAPHHNYVTGGFVAQKTGRAQRAQMRKRELRAALPWPKPL